VEHVPKVFRSKWEDLREVDFAHGLEGIGRFLVHAFHQRARRHCAAPHQEHRAIILIGEMRVRETLETAISAAETGHLVLSTMHPPPTVAQSLTRVFAFFPSEEQIPARGVIAGSLRGFVCQQLVPKIDGYGRLPVIEILTVDATVKTLIVEGQIEKIQGLLAGSSDSASGSFNKDPYRLWKAGASARRGWAAETRGAEAPAPPCEDRIASAFGKPDAAARYFKLLKRF
jgi:Tfp pilus assembly pilus retraction ATPase PilT